MRSLNASMMLVMGYLGAVVGAGFASGQEIMQFFVAYGNCGYKGAILATLLFALSGGALLYTAHQEKISSYQTMIKHLMGPRAGVIVDAVLALFLFLGISTMLSASGAVFYEHLYLSKNLGIFSAYILVGVFLITGKRGLIMSYNFLVPLKLVLLLLIAGYAAFFASGSQPSTTPSAPAFPVNLRLRSISAHKPPSMHFARCSMKNPYLRRSNGHDGPATFTEMVVGTGAGAPAPAVTFT